MFESVFLYKKKRIAFYTMPFIQNQKKKELPTAMWHRKSIRTEKHFLFLFIDVKTKKGKKEFNPRLRGIRKGIRKSSHILFFY